MVDGQIYLDGWCGNASSGRSWAFWDDQITLNTTVPHFTECFMLTVVMGLPCACIIIPAPFYIFYLSTLATVRTFRQISNLNIAKVVINILVCILVLAELVRQTVFPVDGYLMPVIYVMYSIYSLTQILTTIIMHVEYRKGFHTSGLMFLFWLILSLAGLIPFVARITAAVEDETYINRIGVWKFASFYISYILIFVELALQFKADMAAQDWDKYICLESYDKKKSKCCPELKASFASRVMFAWMFRLMVQGYRKTLVFNDLWLMRPVDSSKYIFDKFVKAYRSQRSKQRRKERSSNTVEFTASVSNADQPEVIISDNGGERRISMMSIYTKVFGWTFFHSGIFKLLSDAITFGQPLLLNLMIQFIESNDSYLWKGYLLGVCLFGVSWLRAIFAGHHMNINQILGMRLRTMITAAVYRKSLLINSEARKGYTSGEIANLMSVDAQKMQDVPMMLHFTWAAPLTIAAALVYLWTILGVATLAGIGVLVIIFPVNVIFAKLSRTLLFGTMRYKDARLKTMTEILSGMKVLKLYAWEPAFEENITEIRKDEMKTLKSAAIIDAIAYATWFLVPSLMALCSFAVYVEITPSHSLSPTIAFVSLNLFNIMQAPILVLSNMIRQVLQGYVSTKRIGNFLSVAELDPNEVKKDGNMDEAIKITGADFSWGKNEEPSLTNINLNVKSGSLVGVVGPVGAGKSSLINGILGEMDIIQGSAKINGSVAYVPQQAWIQNATLQDNILFGSKMHRKKYDRCVEACALEADFKILPGGDFTEVGDKGINVSGGQKQRISLARAVYQNNDIYLLDDPLSAVDSHVGKHIFTNVIGNNGLLKEKTRVFVTHGLLYLPHTDYVVMLGQDGNVLEDGTFQELLVKNGAFADLVKNYIQDDDEFDDDPHYEEFKADIVSRISAFSDIKEEPKQKNLRVRRISRQMSRQLSREADKEHVEEDLEKKKKLITEETIETGNIKLSVYTDYFRAVGIVASSIILIFWLAYIGFSVGVNTWLKEWSEEPMINGTVPKYRSDLRLGIYGTLIALQTCAMLGMSFAVAIGTIIASRGLHDGMLACILRAPMSFFDTTPLGRIVNRFSKDTDIVDINIPMLLKMLLATFSIVLSTLIIICISTPIFLAALVPLALIYYFIQRFYIATARQLKRIDSIKRSPVYSHFGETVTGAPSIRAYGRNEEFIIKADKLNDDNNMAYFPNISSTRWLSMWLDFMGALVVLAASMFAVAARDTIGAGTVGLSISYALSITGILTRTVTTTCDMESSIVSVERVQEYTEVESEAPWEIPEKKPKDDWPDAGRVVFDEYSTRYREGLDLVVRGIDCAMKPGEKVGIIGRTGAGKSSLTLALFRLIEPAEGSIIIDGLDAATLGLHDLRSKITIIPQDPVLFAGSLRMNLDPFDAHTDQDIWSCLELANLKNFVTLQPEHLDFLCSEGGENMSVGQRQLVCLARALLRRTKILVLDEATAAVDLETDDLIQYTIRTHFRDSTVITIAHRLNTIMDYDRIMVLDKGEIKEFDSPNDLLRDDTSIFYDMAKDAGLV
ncbi:multidrug resistance-associated protein 1-like isoform X2 [Lineus longissimus]|uniref:multidrug resistance-associated protein 1-like isoform X2 n=1 Tax=Lineus longissimus TaxID=88925 RepID=UPI002B4C96DB